MAGSKHDSGNVNVNGNGNTINNIGNKRNRSSPGRNQKNARRGTWTTNLVVGATGLLVSVLLATNLYMGVTITHGIPTEPEQPPTNAGSEPTGAAVVSHRKKTPGSGGGGGLARANPNANGGGDKTMDADTPVTGGNPTGDGAKNPIAPSDESGISDTKPLLATALRSDDLPVDVPGVGADGSGSGTKIQILLPPGEVDWIRRRARLFEERMNLKRLRAFYQKAYDDPLSRTTGGNNTSTDHYYAIDSGNNPRAARGIYGTRAERRKANSDGADPSGGPWLDFMVAGNPKCGTTTLMANLRRIAPMPVKDFCTGVTQTLRNSYLVWPKNPDDRRLVAEHMGEDPKHWMRGSKCPRFLGQNFLLGFGSVLPKTKLIVGIRHPVDWFTSFWKMGVLGGGEGILRAATLCPCPVDPQTGLRPKTCPETHPGELCFGECRCGFALCLHRARLHLPLARLGKTGLTPEERLWLAPKDDDGGANLFDARISNPVFLYDLTQMKNTRTKTKEETIHSSIVNNNNNNNSTTDFWEDLAGFLGVSRIPNEEYHGSKGKGGGNKNLTLCVPRYDYFRSMIMAYSYEMGVWIQTYLLPVAADPDRPDLVVAGTAEAFRAIAETYKEDPCGRLVRRESDGVYVLKKSGPPPESLSASNHEETAMAMDTSLPKQCSVAGRTKDKENVLPKIGDERRERR